MTHKDGPWSRIIVYGLWSMVLFSCTTQKQLTYLQNIDEVGEQKIIPYSMPDYRLQRQDILYVRFSAVNEEINNQLNAGNVAGIQATNISMGGGYLIGYTINDSGDIVLPVLGKINVLDRTMEEVTTVIEDKVAEYFNDVTVVVRLLSYKVTILGEVKSPGTYQNYNRQLNIMEALGMAGDLTDYGNRSRVLVIRSSEDGTNSYRLDLKNKDLLSSEKYFLLPNDVVIVEPRQIKLIAWNAPTVSLFFSTIFSTISLTLLIFNAQNN